MAGLVDYEALVLDLRGALQERASWGRGQIVALINDLEQRHRIDESAEAAMLRHFGAHLTDSFLGLLPRSATPDPLPSDDRSATSAAMDDGAASDHHHHGGDECPLHSPTPSPSTLACRTADQVLAAARPLAAAPSS